MENNWKEYQQWLDSSALSWQVNDNDQAPRFNAICTDSRSIKTGNLFVPLRGEKFDGHEFIAEALKKGAAYFFYDTKFNPERLSPNEKARGLAVTDTLQALHALARGARTKINPAYVFALVGSVGKTTAKQMLVEICRKDDATLCAKGSFNNEIGVPLTLLQLHPSHKHLVLEMGTRHIGDISTLCAIAQPTIVGWLNVKGVHLSEFGSIENIYQAKSEIFRDSPKDATLITCADDPKLVALAKETGKKMLTFGTDEKADVRISEIEWRQSPVGMQIHLLYKGEKLAIALECAHTAYPLNVAAVVAMALAAQINPEAIKAGLANFRPETGRFQIHQNKGLTVIDDSYNASPASMLAGFESCAKLFAKASKIAVLGDMKELGPTSSELHLDIGKKCMEVLRPDLLITVGEEAKNIAKGAIDAGLSKEKLFSFEDVGQAQRLPERVYRKRDVIYVKGSHSMQLEKLVATLIQTTG